ncbi:MAG: IclR family transcriptional regulator [Deltaproteobacteria bacterium]|nr:IclR family transcriptional regulator [Deltaproteobacteria bacterium]
MKQKRPERNSVEKALDVLLAFQEEQPSWGVRELSAHLGFSPATVQRLLQSLKRYGFVDQNPRTRQYHLGTVYFQFLDTLKNTYPITRAALPFMRKLSFSTQETVHLNILDGTSRLCIENVESRSELKASMPIGNRSPLYAGASSKCLLAFSPPGFIESYLERAELIPLTENTITNIARLLNELDRIRKQGYSTSFAERTPGLGALSAPIQNHRGELVAALSLAMPDVRFKNEQHYAFCLKELVNVAGEFSRTMGYHKTT